MPRILEHRGESFLRREASLSKKFSTDEGCQKEERDESKLALLFQPKLLTQLLGLIQCEAPPTDQLSKQAVNGRRAGEQEAVVQRPTD